MRLPPKVEWLMSLSLPAPAHGRVLADYLCILKEMKTQVDSVQNFLNAHISLLEEVSNHRPRQKTDALPGFLSKERYLFNVLVCRTHQDLAVILIAFNPHNVLISVCLQPLQRWQLFQWYEVTLKAANVEGRNTFLTLIVFQMQRLRTPQVQRP